MVGFPPAQVKCLIWLVVFTQVNSHNLASLYTQVRLASFPGSPLLRLRLSPPPSQALPSSVSGSPLRLRLSPPSQTLPSVSGSLLRLRLSPPSQALPSVSGSPPPSQALPSLPPRLSPPSQALPSLRPRLSPPSQALPSLRPRLSPPPSQALPSVYIIYMRLATCMYPGMLYVCTCLMALHFTFMIC